MTIRNLARAITLLVLVLVFNSVAAAAPPKDKSPPTAPTNLRITASGPNSISLAWNASKDNSSNWWYCVQRDGLGCFRVDPPQTTFTNPYLWPATTFRYSVIAIDAAGNRSAPSNTVTFTTPPDTTPPTAPVLSAVSALPIRISVSWTQSVENVTQVFYTLLVDGSPYGSDLIGYRSATVIHLLPSTTHVFKVVARDGFGNTSESNVLTVTTPPATDAVPPTAPTNLRLSSESAPPEAWLDWDRATDNSDPPSQIQYEIFVNGVLASTGIGSNEDIVYCAGVGPIRIAVRAVDTSGNASAFGNEIVFVC